MLVLHDPPFSSTKRRSPQKRQGSSKILDEGTRRNTKKRKLDHPLHPPPRFWDNLSEPVLTKNALRELDRRNAAKLHPQLRPEHRYRRPRTRRVAVARRKAGPLSAQEFLQQSSPTELAQLGRFARHGGPNLKDLRGYRQSTDPEMSSSHSSLGRRKRGSQSPAKTNTTPNTTTTRSTGPYDCAFQQHLIDHDIFPSGYEYPDGDELPEPDIGLVGAGQLRGRGVE